MEKKPDKPEAELPEIDADIRDVMQEQTRVASGRGPSVAKEAQRKRAIV
jgi:hypothetical protein